MPGTQIKRIRKQITVSSRMQDWIDGKIKPEELTDDEVFKMQLHDRNGKFSGPPPRLVPRDLAMAFRSEAQKRAMAWFQEHVPDAQKAILEVVRSRHLMPGDAARLRAAEGILERVIGKVPNATDMHVVVDDKKTFEDHAADIVMDLDVEDD